MKRLGSVLATGALALAVHVIPASEARADGGITANAVCDSGSGTVLINFTATSRGVGPFGTNSQADILFNSVAVASGAFTDPTYAFSGSRPAPAGAGPGDPVTVTGVAVAT